MIIIDTPNDKPQIEIGQFISQDVLVKTIPDVPLDDPCLCSFGAFQCTYKEIGFYGGSNKYENDYTDLFVNKVDTTDVIKLTMINVSDNVETELNDANKSTYGIYSEDENHKGIKIDFDTLKTNYPTLVNVKFRIDHNIFGVDRMSETHIFNLVKWDLERADGTVRIETINSGLIESGNNYGSLNWEKSVRVKGKLGGWSPDLQTDNLISGGRVIRQIQDKIIIDYTLETELLPDFIYRPFILNDNLANRMIISDYNLKNVNYKGVELQPKSIVANHYEKNANSNFEIILTERTQNNIKHNL